MAPSMNGSLREFLNPEVSRFGFDPSPSGSNRWRPMARSASTWSGQSARSAGEVAPAKAQGVQSLRTRISIARQGIAQQWPERVHVGVKYLPKMADETSRRYLFVAIDPLPGSGLPSNRERGGNPLGLYPHLQLQDCRQCPPVPARSRTGLPDADQDHFHR